MPEPQSDNVWDEYRWERFLQEQEARTEKYIELLDRYIDHPQRQEIIAREMGWDHLLDGEAREWEEAVDAGFEAEADDETLLAQAAFAFEQNPLYQQALALNEELDGLLASDTLAEHPAAIALCSQLGLAAAKLAAALNDDDVEELGMSIAYLKRALHAVTNSLNAAQQLSAGALIPPQKFNQLRNRLFEVRDGIITKMGELRAEFRRKRGR